MADRPAHRDQPLPRLVVVGAGMAATRLVEELVARRATERFRITVLGEEQPSPYNRILLSAVLEGTHRAEALTLRAPAWYGDRGIVLRRGTRVQAIDRAARVVVLADGEQVGYERLVLATGSVPTLPPIRGLVAPDGGLHAAVHAFRSQADCARLLAAIEATEAGGRPVNRRAVVIGGGLLGLQVARALGVHGLDTEIVEGAEHVLHRQIDAAAGRILTRDLTRLGVAVYTGARAVRLDEGAAHAGAGASGGAGLACPRPDRPVATSCVPSIGGSGLGGRVRVLDPLPRHPGRLALRLDNGFTLDTDLIVLAAGARPSTTLARAAGLDVRRGVVVDDRLTSVTDACVHAIGDCAETRAPDGSGRTSGNVSPAWEQAGVLAGVLCEEGVRYDGSRVVARLRATGLDVAALGEAEREIAAGGEVVEVANPIAGSHRRLVVRGGRIVAATLVGDLSRIGLITQHFDRQTVLGANEPGDLLLATRAESGSNGAPALFDDVEVCACAGVTAGQIRACSSLAVLRDTTRATTGCGGCTPTVRQLLGSDADLITKGSP